MKHSLHDKEQACSTCMSSRFFAAFLLVREAGRLWENWLVTETAFPSPRCHMSCAPGGVQLGHVTPNGPRQVGQEKQGGRLVERHPGSCDDGITEVSDGLGSLGHCFACMSP